MSAIIDHHEQSPETDVPVNSPPDAVITSATWSSPPPAFPVTPHDVTEPERPLDKTIEPFQSEASLASPLTVVNSEFKQDASDPTESSSPQPNSTCTPQPEHLPQPTHRSPLPPVPAPASLSSSSSVEPTDSPGTHAGTDLPRPVLLTPCPAPTAASEPGSPGRSAPTDHLITRDERTEHAQLTAEIADDTGSLSIAPDDAPTIPPGAAPLPAAANEIDIPSRPVSPSVCPADPAINPLTSTLPPPEPSDNPPSPIPTHPTSSSNGPDPLPPVIPPAGPEEPSTSSLDPRPELTPHDQSALPHPEQVAPATASINSLSPLSDVPSAPSPPHALDSPTNRSSQLPPLHCPSTASFKRQPSPSMYDNSTSTARRAEDSPNHINGSRTEPNGQSAPKRPRLDSDSSVNPPMSSSLLKPVSDAPQTAINSYPPAPSLPTAAPYPTPSTTETMGFVPGTLGTRFTKDQHRFATSVTKQLKKHRSAGPFLAPVDPVALNIPDYFNVVKQPMDLSTIETRLGKAGKPCHYRSAEEFVADIQLVFSNCYMYNGPPATSPYSRMALDLSIQFETQMKKMPPDEPISHASTSRSPSLVKPAPKSKQTTDTRAPVPPLKRKNGSMAVDTPIQPGHSGSQKRRSASPQHPRKKGTKAASVSASVLQSADPVNANAIRRTSMNDPSSSHRPNTESWVQSAPVGADYGGHQMCSEPPMVSNAEAELKFCHNLLREVNKKVYSKFVWPFYEPVDIVKLGIPDYPKYVKKPMDLETMRLKLKNNEYPNGAAFAEDFRLMLDNCYAFNPTGTYRECGQQLERLFEEKWAERPPEEVPAPAPPPVAPVSTAATLSDPILQLQMQVAQLQEHIKFVHATNPGLAGGHVIPGTGPPKKQSIPRAPAASKSSTNLLNNSGPVLPPSTLTAASKGKLNGAGAAKPKQNQGGARRKSAASTSTPSAKRPTHAVEHLPLSGQVDQHETTREPYQPLPSTGAAIPSAPPSAAKKNFSGSDYFEVIDYEQKKDLAAQIQNAVEPMQSDAINLIRNSRPDLVAADGEEIELDIDALDDRTLYQLYQLVCAPLLPPTKPKKPKAAPANGKAKGGRKTGPGATRKSMPTAMPSFAAPVSQASGAPYTELAPVNPYPSAQVANGHENGTKPKAKKPRASAPGPPKRKGIDESEVAAHIKQLEEKLTVFDGVTNSQQQPLHHANGLPSTNPALGPNSSAPPVGPVEYASSSSESESDSDDDSD